MGIFKINSCPYCGEKSGNPFACARCCGQLKKLVNSKVGKTKDCFFFTAPFIYKGIVRDAILDFKFKKQTEFCDSFAHFMAICDIPDFDVLVCVPTFVKDRKFNSSKEISIRFKKRKKIKFLKDAVIKIRKTENQHNCSYFKRINNLKGAFKVETKKIVGKRVLICDDIITTASTVQEISLACKNAGAKLVGAISFAVSEMIVN